MPLYAAESVLEEINFYNTSIDTPTPKGEQTQLQKEDDFSPELPKTPPPDVINIVMESNYEEQITNIEKSLETDKIPYLDIVIKAAKEQNFDVELTLAIIKKESTFNPKLKSNAGAIGLMQLLPETAQWLGLKNTSKLYEPSTNIRYGIKYLRYLFDRFAEINPSDLKSEDIERQDVKKVLAAYNAGPGNVEKYDKPPHNGIPPFKETKSYVKIVTQYFKDFKNLNIQK